MNKIDGLNSLHWMLKCHADENGNFMFTRMKIIEEGKQENKTTHTLAMELMRLPNVPIEIEVWCMMDGHVIKAKMTEYDPEGTAILVQEKMEKNEVSHDSADTRPLISMQEGASPNHNQDDESE